ncbi:glycosyltransferase [Lachnospiraceae bacterium ZAX-1]
MENVEGQAIGKYQKQTSNNQRMIAYTDMPFHERKYDIVFNEEYKDPVLIYHDIINKYSGKLGEFAHFMIEDLKKKPNRTLEQCLTKALELYQTPVADEDFYDLRNAFRGVDEYIRYYFMDKMIRMLIEHKMKVHVFGYEWRDFQSEYVAYRVVGKGDCYTVQKAVANAKISIHINAHSEGKFQERIEAAMFGGAIAVTDESPYIKENFTNGKDIVVYSLENLEELPKKILELQTDKKKTSQIAASGKELVASWHKVVCTTQEVLDSFFESDEALLKAENSTLQQILLETNSNLEQVVHKNGLLMEQVELFRRQKLNILVARMIKRYEKNADPELRSVIEYVVRNKDLQTFNYDFVSKYVDLDYCNAIHYDEKAAMYYIDSRHKKTYFPKKYTREKAVYQFRFLSMEQDEESPHLYCDRQFDVPDGGIVIDAGAGEGNFSLDIIERIKKIYIIESEHEWVEALEKTFEPWKGKVVIVEKMLGCVNDDTHITIDTLVEEAEVNFIKMDVEGMEEECLRGATRILFDSTNIKCAICSYHKRNAEQNIRLILEKYGFYTTTTKGYMFFLDDIDSFVEGELRHGIVRGVK